MLIPLTEEIASNFVDEHFDDAWKICKDHKLFHGISKQMMRSQRAGVIAMKILDLHEARELTQSDYDKIYYFLKK